MSTYAQYIEYAKESIGELKQLETLKKTHKGAKLAQAIKEKGLKKITKSYVDSILHGLGKSRDYSPLTDSQKEIAKELQDIGEKVALTYKDKAISGILEKVSINALKLGMLHEMTVQNDEVYAVHSAILKLKKNPNYYSILESKNENAEMSQSDVTKIIDYSEKLQSMFNVNDNLEDWVKAKLNHACDYVATVRDYLKFYRNEKEAGTPVNQIDEKWSNAYKKSIDCSNAKGFSQKAHCRARQLRKAGKDTKSKSVKECYKEALQELLKEQDSSMAMGALKQLNSDAKELQSMLQPTTQLEDWVKAKLNLAGEYLDDVYHHLDHFGSQGRKLDEVLKELNYEGGVGIHEFAVFFQKASKEEEEQMNNCLKTNNVSCVKSLIQKVTGMPMDKIGESFYADKEAERLRRQMRFGITESGIKRYWFTPQGTYEDAGNSHEQWIKKNAPELVGANVVVTYDKAIEKGYIRAILDNTAGIGMLTLSNLRNYDFSFEGSSAEGIPAVSTKVVDAIHRFVEEKDVRLVATGHKGKILKNFTKLDENQITEDWKKALTAATALAAATAFGTGSLQAKAKLPSTPSTITRTVTYKQPTSTSVKPSGNNSFINYLKYVENGNRVGYDKNKKLWFPHKSFEGGSDTIGYGHKIQPGENFSKGITDSEAETLLKKDIEKARIKINSELKGTKLTPKQEEMFIDFVFNMGTLKKFPKFTKAVLKNDIDGMKSQYKRYAGGKELKGRNTAFAKRYLEI